MFKPNDALTYIDEPYVRCNKFINKKPAGGILPDYDSVKCRLPSPVWDGHESSVECYDEAWRIAFSNLRKPAAGSGLVSDFIDTAFNGFTFMWDSSFMVMFGKYAANVFNFQTTLDNFYAKQHRDGFICREICETENADQFYRHDPSSTGPNIMPWSEWEYYKITGDKERLNKVFDPLMGYYNWLRLNRTWPNGMYWSTGWGCGMDNIIRLQPGYSNEFSHGHQVWIDATVQQIFSAKLLIKMGRELGRADGISALEDDVSRLSDAVNSLLWSEDDGFYYDMWKNGELNRVKTVGSYWALMAEIVPPERLDRFVAHLNNEREFNRPNRVPALSADDKNYCAEGGYWRGGVWAPTTYMVLKGLEKNGYDKLAFDIAESHLKCVVSVFEKTGTLWENYSPEYPEHGNPAKDRFVGWTGLSPISIMFEYVFGIRSDTQHNKIVWNVNLCERHGINRYPFKGAEVGLICEARNKGEKPVIHVKSKIPFTLEIHWDSDGGNKETLNIQPDI